MNFQAFKQKLLGLNRPEIVEYTNEDLSYQIGYMLKKARLVKGLTQKELAIKVGTKQESIARSEKGTYLPSLSFLKKIADAFNSKLIIPMFDFLSNDSDLDFYNIKTQNINANFFVKDLTNMMRSEVGMFTATSTFSDNDKSQKLFQGTEKNFMKLPIPIN